MNIEYTSKFKRHFKKRIANNPELLRLFKSSFEKFIDNPYSPDLETHKLTGRLRGFWAYTVAYDCRVVFSFEDNNKTAVFSDVGKHDEVY